MNCFVLIAFLSFFVDESHLQLMSLNDVIGSTKNMLDSASKMTVGIFSGKCANETTLKEWMKNGSAIKSLNQSFGILCTANFEFKTDDKHQNLLKNVCAEINNGKQFDEAIETAKVEQHQIVMPKIDENSIKEILTKSGFLSKGNQQNVDTFFNRLTKIVNKAVHIYSAKILSHTNKCNNNNNNNNGTKNSGGGGRRGKRAHTYGTFMNNAGRMERGEGSGDSLGPAIETFKGFCKSLFALGIAIILYLPAIQTQNTYHPTSGDQIYIYHKYYLIATTIDLIVCSVIMLFYFCVLVCCCCVR